MKRILASTSLALSAVMLASCGFTPVYGANVSESAGPIQIDQIDGASGHVLRKELVALLRPGLPGIEYGTLRITAEEKTQNFAYRVEGGDVRKNNQLICKYVLETSEGPLRGSVTGEAGFFSPLAPYADITANRESQILAAKDAARKIVTELQFQVKELAEKKEA